MLVPNFLIYYTFNDVSTHQRKKVFLEQISNTGQLLWNKEFNLSTSYIYISPHSSYFDSTHIYLAHTSINNGLVNCMYSCLDASTGAQLWNNIVYGNVSSSGHSIVPLSTNKILVDGNTSSNDFDFSGNHGSGSDYFYAVLRSGTHNIIKGKAFIDADNNGSYNAGSDFLVSQGFATSSKNNTRVISYSNENGEYLNYADTGSYNTIFTGYNNYYTVSPLVKTTSHSTYNNVDSVDFALTPKGAIHDLRVTLVNTWVTRPGFANSYEAMYVNEGTTTIDNATITVLLDNRLTYNDAVPMPTAIVGDTLKWDLAALVPSQQGKIRINFTGKTPPDLNENNAVISKAAIYPIAIDSTPLDNQYTLTDIARNSFDPNDKNIESNASLTPAQVATGNYITYRIRFQNTGNFYAANVIITDFLDNNLDWSSLQIISASHTGLQTTITHDNKVEFQFYNINLPAASQNEPASHGYIIFKIKPKNNLVVGNLISNTSHITFDFNPPVKTNTAIARIIAVTATINHANVYGNIELYPNPTNGIFTVDFKANGIFPITASIIDVSGRLLFEKKMEHNLFSSMPFNDITLAEGVYIIKIDSPDDSWYKKVIVQQP